MEEKVPSPPSLGVGTIPTENPEDDIVAKMRRFRENKISTPTVSPTASPRARTRRSVHFSEQATLPVVYSSQSPVPVRTSHDALPLETSTFPEEDIIMDRTESKMKSPLSNNSYAPKDNQGAVPVAVGVIMKSAPMDSSSTAAVKLGNGEEYITEAAGGEIVKADDSSAAPVPMNIHSEATNDVAELTDGTVPKASFKLSGAPTNLLQAVHESSVSERVVVNVSTMGSTSPATAALDSSNNVRQDQLHAPSMIPRLKSMRSPSDDKNTESIARTPSYEPPLSPDMSMISEDNASSGSPGRRRSITPQRQQFLMRKNTAGSTPKNTPLLASLDESTWSAYSKKMDTAMLTKSSQGEGEMLLQKTVAVRVRPFLGDELAIPRRIVSGPAQDRILIVNPNSFNADPDTIAAAAMLTNCADWAKDFRFSNCFWSLKADAGKFPEGCSFASQVDVFSGIGQGIVEGAGKGISTTCLAYGHTGTGKTYSMFGDFDDSTWEAKGLGEHAGLVPRVFSGILDLINGSPDLCGKVAISFLEIHNERIRDLLRVSEVDVQLKVREHPGIGTYVENLIKVDVYSVDELLRVLKGGLERRSTASTSRNSSSSRSHAIVTLEIARDADSTATQEQYPAITRIQMVDLAGSEKDFSERDSVDSSAIEGSPKYGSSKKSFRAVDTLDKTEMKLIRKSLSTLGYIIKALSKGSVSKGLPYRDSALTWLLKDALCSGKCNTVMLSTISPSHLCYEETLSTLKYAQRLGLIGKSSSESGLTVKWADKLVTDNGVENIKKLQDDLGASRPGTDAARILLKQTVNDPQQRLAKLNFSTSVGVAIEESTPIRPPRDGDRRVPETPSTSYADLRDSYRVLRGQNIELQIELDAARADRDGLLNEIQALREAAESRDRLNSSRRNNSDYTSVSWEQEKNELRATIARKDDNIDKLLTDLASEKLSRAAVERLANSQINEFNALASDLNGKIEHLSAEIASLKAAEIEQRDSYKQLEVMYTDKVAMVKGACDRQVQILEEGLSMAESRLALMTRSRDEAANAMKQLDDAHRRERQIAESKLLDEVNQLRGERDELLVQRENNLRLIGDLTKKVNDIEIANISMASKVNESEIAALVSERDSLLQIIEQQNKDHESIQRMSQASLKMLQQRQSFLDERGLSDSFFTDGVLRLQDTLQSMLNKEGDILQSEIMDAKKLTEMIASTRKSLHKLVKSKDGVRQQSDADTSVLAPSQELIDELNYYKRAVADADAAANYWRSIANGGAKPSGIVDSNEANGEVEFLKQQLEAKDAELEQVKKTMNRSQLEMQKEFASLWLAVQQLNKVDAVKDKSLIDIQSERDRIVKEKDEALRRYKKLKGDYKTLQEEVKAIDDDLIRAVDAEGISIDDILSKGSSKNIPMESRLTDMIRNPGSEVLLNISSSAVKRREGPNESHISEMGLERQITELSTFLTQDSSSRSQQVYKRAGNSAHLN